MTRTTILYDGAEYVVAKTAEEVRAEIDEILATGKAGWIVVNHGRGKLQRAELLVSPSISVSLIDTTEAG